MMMNDNGGNGEDTDLPIHYPNASIHHATLGSTIDDTDTDTDADNDIGSWTWYGTSTFRTIVTITMIAFLTNASRQPAMLPVRSYPVVVSSQKSLRSFSTIMRCRSRYRYSHCHRHRHHHHHHHLVQAAILSLPAERYAMYWCMIYCRLSHNQYRYCLYTSRTFTIVHHKWWILPLWLVWVAVVIQWHFSILCANCRNSSVIVVSRQNNENHHDNDNTLTGFRNSILRWNMIVVHFDHQQRGTASDDHRIMVQTLCRQYSRPCYVHI